MLKKLFIPTIGFVALAVFTLTAATVSADYYDCSGNLRPGEPGPSECHYFIRPPQRSQTPSYTPSDDTNVLVPTYREPSYTPDDDTVNVLVPEPRDPYTDDDDVNILVPEDREPTYSDEPRYEMRNVRKYCIRDYCYIVYDYCDDSGHCVEKMRKYPNPDYNDDYSPDQPDYIPSNDGDYYSGNTWNYWINYYIYNYYRNLNPHTCDYSQGRCIYRGFHFGGFHNGYWYY